MALFRFEGAGLWRADGLSWVMAGLILFVITNVIAYSHRYLAGDRNSHGFRGAVVLLGGCVAAMVFADHLLVLLCAWTGANLLLARLMTHEIRWPAARNAGLLALKTFAAGSFLLGAGFWILAEGAGTASLHRIVHATGTPRADTVWGLTLVAIAAMTQSAAWPFHRWLTSSLNSPSPVSALMHAGLVNGGGFLLVRFAPLYASQPGLLRGLFVAGLATALIGSYWKLIQTDVKRMLACSTMGQMGFMIMQCGLGLFGPAVSHLCWHGLFKAYSFLNTGSVVREARSRVSERPLTAARFMLACVAGIAGAATFSLVTGMGLRLADTGVLMSLLAFMTATQLAVGVLDKMPGAAGIATGGLAAVGAGLLYGLSVRGLETALGPIHASHPQALDVVHIVGFALIVIPWLGGLFNLTSRLQGFALWKRVYIAALNASQPHASTVTATRTAYQS
jgi:NAD(P)H-quinone oxidoreductase subunit 5